MGLLSLKQSKQTPATKTLIPSNKTLPSSDRLIVSNSRNSLLPSNNRNCLAPSSSRNRLALSNEYEAPPAYQTWAAYTYVPSLIDEKVLVDVALLASCNTEISKFNKARLKAKCCIGLLKLYAEIENCFTPLVLGMKSDNSVTYDHPQAPKSTSLFAEWVDTGKLRVTIKHKSVSTDAYSYYLLYILADILGSEVLCNSVLDEIIDWYSAVGYHPSITTASHVSKMASGALPQPLQGFFVANMALRTVALEGLLMVNTENWAMLGELQQPLFMALLYKSQGKAVVIPGKHKCHFHVHKESQLCTK